MAENIKSDGTGALNDYEWNELTEQDKIDRTNGNDELPEGWTDWNKVPLDEMANLLENKYKFNSSSEAKCINELIRFYRAQKPPEKEYYTVWYFTEFGSSKTRCELSEIKDITRKFKVMSIEKEKK